MARSSPRICLMLEQLDYGETYLDIIYKSTIREARDASVQLVVLVGQFIGTENPEHFAQASIFRLISPVVFDGFIICGTMFNQLPSSALSRLSSSLPDLPGIVTTHQIAGLSSVMVDNENGLRQLVRHLIADHGYRRIACIRGPLYHSEADIRVRVWQEEITAAGLVESMGLIVQGHFSHREALNSFRDLMALPGGPPEAVVVCTDELAVEIYDQLVDCGYRVPEDMAVVGFDNIARGLYILSPLSTVNQPIEATAVEAFRQITREARGESQGPVTINLKTEAVIRASCGCKTLEPGADHSSQLLPRLGSEEQAVEVLVQRGLQDKMAPLIIRASLASLHRKYWSVLRLQNSFNEFVRATSMVGSIQDLAPALHKWLPELGIHRYCISVCASPEGQFEAVQTVLEQGELIAQPPSLMLMIAASPLPGQAHEGETIFASAGLAVQGWLDLVSPIPLVGLPLTVGSNWYGLVVIEITDQDSVVYRSIQNHLSTILDREFRLGRMLELAIQEQANARSEQQKLQALSSLVRGMAHEMNTPLGIGITSSSFLKAQLEELSSVLNGPGIMRTVLDRFMSDVSDSNQLIQRSLERTAKLVTLFKDVAVTETSSLLEYFDVSVCIREAIAALPNAANGQPVRVELNLPPSLHVQAQPESFRRMLAQFIANASQNPRSGQSAVTVKISLVADLQEPDWWVLTVSDDGCGMNPEELSHVFEPFFTKQRVEGHTGLGLHIVWNIVRHLLGGSIQCLSEPGEGTSFVIRFPEIAPTDRNINALGV